MKFIFIFLCCVVFASSLEQETFKLRPENIKNIQKASDECAAELSADPGTFIKAAEGNLPRDETTYKYLFCLAEKVKVADANGHMNVDKTASYLGNDHPLAEKFKEAIRKCNEVTKETPVATFLEVYYCYFKTAPVLFAV